MSEEQIKILNDIADRIESKPVTIKDAHNRLVNAGIITEKGNIRKPYRGVFLKRKP